MNTPTKEQALDALARVHEIGAADDHADTLRALNDSGWIDVNERLPEPGAPCWIATRHGVVLTGWYDEWGWQDYVYGWDDEDITHWMPATIPVHPKAGAK